MMDKTEPFVAIEDLARHFAVSISTIRSWVRQGHIPKKTYIKIGNTYRFDKTSVSDALTSLNIDLEGPSVKHTEHDEEQLEFDFTADEDV